MRASRTRYSGGRMQDGLPPGYDGQEVAEGEDIPMEENILAALEGGEVDNVKVENRKASLLDAIYGVMYTLLKEKSGGSWKSELSDILIHFLQLYLVVLSQDFDWEWGLDRSILFNISLAEIDNLLQYLGYSVYLVTFWVLFSILMLSLAICAWVAQNFKTGKFPFLFPIKLARVFVGFFFQTFYITSLSVFVMAMNCDFLSPSGDGPDLVLFPGRRCDQAPHLFVALLAVPGTILMALVAWFMTIGESEMDPMARELTAVPFPHANTKIFLAVTTLDVLSVVLRGWGKQTGLLVSWLGCYIVYVQLRWVPYLTDWVNQLECALYSVMTYMGFCLTALSYKGPPFESVSMTAIYGSPAAFLVGWLAMTWRLRHARKYAIEFKSIQGVNTSMFSDREDGRFSLGTRMSVMARVSMGVRAFIGAATLRNNKKNSARFTGHGDSKGKLQGDSGQNPVGKGNSGQNPAGKGNSRGSMQGNSGQNPAGKGGPAGPLQAQKLVLASQLPTAPSRGRVTPALPGHHRRASAEGSSHGRPSALAKAPRGSFGPSPLGPRNTGRLSFAGVDAADPVASVQPSGRLPPVSPPGLRHSTPPAHPSAHQDPSAGPPGGIRMRPGSARAGTNRGSSSGNPITSASEAMQRPRGPSAAYKGPMGSIGELYHQGSARLSVERVERPPGSLAPRASGPRGSTGTRMQSGMRPGSAARASGARQSNFGSLWESGAIPQFPSPNEVQLAARCMRIRDEFGNLVDEWLAAAERILAAGVKQFPDDPELRLLVSHYLLHVRKNPAKSAGALKTARGLPMSLGLRFQLFCRDREATQAGAGSGFAGTEGAMDLVSYVEFHNNFKAVQKHHAAALKATRDFWRELMKKDIAFQTVTDLVGRASTATHMASSVFRSMLRQHPNNVKLLRAHGHFLREVANDPWRALKQFELADRIEDAQAQARREKLLQEMVGAGENALSNRRSSMGHKSEAGSGPIGRAFSMNSGAGRSSIDRSKAGEEWEGDEIDDTRDAVIAINENGIVVMTNRLLNHMFGYKMGELEGMNVTAIMPPPFSQQHNNYLRAYKQTGVSAVLNRKREVVAMAKDRTVFPVMLGVTKMVQSDGSVQFLGVIKRKHAEDRYAELWVTSAGGVLCASEGFQALTGFTSMELANTAVDSLSFMRGQLQAEVDKMAQEVARMNLENEDAVEAGEPELPHDLDAYEHRFEAPVRHRWMPGPIPVRWKVAMSGTPEHRILRLLGRPDIHSRDPGCLVVAPTGAVKYASRSVESLLALSRREIAAGALPVSRLIGGPTGALHAGMLQAALRRNEAPDQDVPCFHDHVVNLVTRKKGLVPARVAWRPRREGAEVLYVAAVHPLAEEEERHSWGIDDSGAVSDRQICLRLLVRADGTIVAATDGTGFRPGAPVGALYGVDGESLPGATLDGILELMAAVVNNAQKYDATATPQHVLRGFLWRLALTHIAARVVSFRSGVLCPGGDPGVVPGRVVVVPAHLYGLDLAAMEAAGVVTKKAADAVRRGRMYVVECWSAAWLSGELEAASDDTVRVVNTHLGLITGRADGHMLGRKIGDVLEESERAQLVLREAKRGGRGMEVGVRHFDGGAVACSVTGAQAASGRKHTCLLLRATLEEPESGMESLRRVEVLMMSAESAGTPSATASAMTPRARRRVKAESRGDASSAGGRGGRSAGERGGDEDSGAPSADARRAIGRGRGRGWVERAAAKKGEESTSRSGQSATPRSVSPAPTGVVEAVGGEGKWASAREEEEEEEGEERGAEEAGEEGKVEKGGGLGGLLRKRSVSFRGAKGYGFEEVDLKEMRKENREEEGREEEVLSGSESSWETWSDEEEDEEEEEVAKSRAAVATVAATLFARKRTLGGGVDAGDDGDVAEEDESAHVAAEGLQRAERFRRLQRLLREAQVASMGKSLKKRTLAVVLVALAANLSIFGAFLASVTREMDGFRLAALSTSTSALPSAIATEAQRLVSSTTGGPWSQVVESAEEPRAELMRLASALEAAGERFMDQGLAAATGAARAVAVDEFFAPDPGAAVETSRGLFVVLEDYQQRAMLLAGEAGGVAGARAVERALYLSANAGEKVGPALHGAAMDDARGAAEGMRGVADGAMVAGLVAALGVVPAFMGAVALMVASLNRARASLFSMFFSVPRPVVVALATQDVKVEGVEADEAAKMEETHWEHANLTDADRKVARDIAQGSRAALSGLRLDVTSRRAQAHSARQIALLLLPLLLLAAFVLSLQLGAYAVACGALRPAASLLAVSRCRALVLSVAHYAAAAAVGEATPERLVEEADVLEDLWESVLYGTDTEHPQIGAGLAMPGSLQSDSALSRVLFSEDCLRDPASDPGNAAQEACLPEEHPLYVATHRGLELMIRWYISSAEELANKVVQGLPAEELLASEEMRLIMEVDADIQAGLWRMGRVLQSYVDSRVSGVMAMGIFVVVAATATTALYLKLLSPYIRKTRDEIERAADLLAQVRGSAADDLLAQLPLSMGVEDLVTKSLDIQSDLDIYHGVPLRQRILAHAGSALLKCLLGRRARAMLSLEETFLREKARERRRLEREALGVDLKAVLDGDGAKDVAVAKGRGL